MRNRLWGKFSRALIIASIGISGAGVAVAGDLKPFQAHQKEGFDENIPKKQELLQAHCGLKVPLKANFSKMSKDWDGTAAYEMCNEILEGVRQACTADENYKKEVKKRVKVAVCAFDGINKPTGGGRTRLTTEKDMSLVGGTLTVHIAPVSANIADVLKQYLLRKMNE